MRSKRSASSASAERGWSGRRGSCHVRILVRVPLRARQLVPCLRDPQYPHARERGRSVEPAPPAGPSGGLDLERLCRHVEARLKTLPRYRQRLEFTPIQRRPIWVDDDRFNLRYHVRHTSLPRPGDETKLKELAGRILSQQLTDTGHCGSCGSWRVSRAGARR